MSSTLMNNDAIERMSITFAKMGDGHSTRCFPTGCGTVGGALLDLLTTHGDEIVTLRGMRFKVVRMSERKSASNLTAQQTEAWCFENLGLSLADIPKNQPLFFKLEIRTDDTPARTPLFNSADNFNLTALINLFSRPPERQQWHWTGEAGPFGYADLRQSM